MYKHIFSIGLLALIIQGCTTAHLPKAQDDTSEKVPVTSQTDEKPPVGVMPEIEQQELSGDLLYHLLTAEMAINRSQFQLAVRHYHEAAIISRDPRIIERATRIAVYVRNDTAALAMAQLWVELQPDNVEAHQVLAALLVRRGKADLALKHFEMVLSSSKNGDHNRYMLITSLLSKEKDKQTALNVMEKLVQERQQNPQALYALSHLALLVGSLDKAEAAIGKALKLRPNWTEGLLLQANILNRQGKSAILIELLRTALKNQPDNTNLRLYLARKLVDEKKFPEAREEFARILDNQPEHEDSLYAMGLLGLQMNEPDEAEEYFQRLIELDKRVNEARYYLGQTAEMDNKYEKAIQQYEQIRTGKYYVDAQIRTASLLARQGELEAAREHLQTVSAETMDVELRLFLAEGEILREAKHYKDAFQLYSVALQQMPDNTRLLYARALTAEKMDRIDITIADLSKIVANEPKNAEALNALGYTLVDQTERLAEGTAFIKQAFKLQPEDAAVLDSMGWAYYRNGNHEKALVYLRRAFNKMKDAEIAAHLGEVLWIKGDREAAREVLENALRDTPEHEVLLNVIQRFIK